MRNTNESDCDPGLIFRVPSRLKVASVLFIPSFFKYDA